VTFHEPVILFHSNDDISRRAAVGATLVGGGKNAISG